MLLHTIAIVSLEHGFFVSQKINFGLYFVDVPRCHFFIDIIIPPFFCKKINKIFQIGMKSLEIGLARI
jgi:hypothetical protein